MEAPQTELQSDALQHHRPNRHLAQDDLGNGLELALGQRLRFNRFDCGGKIPSVALGVPCESPDSSSRLSSRTAAARSRAGANQKTPALQ